MSEHDDGYLIFQLVVAGMDPALVALERAKAHVAMTFFLIDPI